MLSYLKKHILFSWLLENNYEEINLIFYRNIINPISVILNFGEVRRQGKTSPKFFNIYLIILKYCKRM